jgi:diaminohydroxyphosphoribosylaminopyrimidine deaminase/5-amino-6-(5-phosphoribosylamino)uracil reductase
MTNLLVEGGSHVFGGLLDAQQIDEVHAFVAPKLVGGSEATPVISGRGVATIQDAMEIPAWQVTQVGGDLHIQGRTAK